MKQSRWLQIPTEPEGKVPGIYVIGLKRSLKGGKFLNVIETERLIDGLRRYVKGARLCRTNQSQDALDSADKELVKWVSTVDWQGGYNLRPDSMPSPQSIQSDGEFSKIEGLISSFELRCDRQLDPTGKVRQVQSPLYVGCSIDLRERTSKYKLHSRGGLLSVNKPLCLVVNILSALEHPVELSHGFNIVEARGMGFSMLTGTLNMSEKSAEMLFGHQNTVKQNLDTTVAGIDERPDFLETLDSVRNKGGDLVKQAKHLTANDSNFQGDTFQKLQDAMMARKEEQSEQIEMVHKQRKQKEQSVQMTQFRQSQRLRTTQSNRNGTRSTMAEFVLVLYRNK
ncbi:hypothetical protein FOVSG1_004889 [Fusarium oxysporum f. sp. vasinfectum]